MLLQHLPPRPRQWPLHRHRRRFLLSHAIPSVCGEPVLRGDYQHKRPSLRRTQTSRPSKLQRRASRNLPLPLLQAQSHVEARSSLRPAQQRLRAARTRIASWGESTSWWRSATSKSMLWQTSLQLVELREETWLPHRLLPVLRGGQADSADSEAGWLRSSRHLDPRLLHQAM